MQRVLVAVVLALGFVSCDSSSERDGRARATPSTYPPPSAAPPSAPPTSAPPPAPPSFEGTVAVIDAATAARMTSSWHTGCPVPLDQLRILTLDHWGYDGTEHTGELVVHADQADAIVSVFQTLFDARFPIERMELVDIYGGDDAASTRANNTAGFNCRSVVGRPGAWSEHAFGRAIDVNPRVNPYVVDPNLRDPELARHLDRSLADPGMIRPDDVVVRAFAAVGWRWGGTWSAPDYQHFSATGR